MVKKGKISFDLYGSHFGLNYWETFSSRPGVISPSVNNGTDSSRPLPRVLDGMGLSGVSDVSFGRTR